MPTPDPPASAADSLADALLREDTDPAALAAAYANAAPFAGGRYRLGDPLGAGAMGRVFRALDTATGTEVALKVMHDEHRADPALAARFREEASLLEKCAHPHVVRLLDSGTDPATGTPWMVMELMAGTLKKWLQRPLHLPRILTWMRAACQAVAHAHRLGIIHRDLKPSNLLLTAENTLKVADFGIAVEKGDAGSIAPDTDLHALGTLFYALLTGRSARANCLPPSEAAARPRWCDDIYDRATSERPGRRFASALEMDAALARAQRWPMHRKPRWPRLFAAAAALFATGLLLWQWPILSPEANSSKSSNHQSSIVNPSPGLAVLNSLPQAPTPASATKDRPFVAASHHFLPVPGHPGVLLAATEVRRSQFEIFAAILSEEETQRLLPGIFDLDGTALSRTTHRWTDTCPLPDDPAAGLNIPAAEVYCQWLTVREKAVGRLLDGAFFRLPWLREWFSAQGVDLAAQAADPPLPPPPYSWGDAWPPPPEAGNFAGLETETDPLRPPVWPILNRRDPFPRQSPAASFRPNAAGFYDMDGNLTEWTRDRATITEHPEPARVLAGLSWMTGAAPERPHLTGYDYDTSAAAARGFRVALQFAPPAVPWMHLTLHRLSDTSGTAQTDNPGAVLKECHKGDTVRVTWRVENFGPPAAILIKSNAHALPPGQTNRSLATVVYRSPKRDKPALGGGLQHHATLATGQVAFFSYDMDTTTWPPGPCEISGLITADTPDAPSLETSASGAALPWLAPQWWQPAFQLREK